MSAFLPSPRDPARDPDHPLARAFASFTEAAGSLERTYGQLQGQVAHLRQELEVTNRDLAKSLEENHRMRERLRRILEGLPCGVLVVEGGTRISILNPEAARLLGGVAENKEGLPPALSAALELFSCYCIAYPQWANQAEALLAVTWVKASVMAASRLSTVRALAERSCCLIFDQACSMGLKSGE
jgi:PAS domain-containing protein